MSADGLPDGGGGGEVKEIGNLVASNNSWGITVLCHFHKNYLIPVISCLTSLTFGSLFHVISITFCPKTRHFYI